MNSFYATIAAVFLFCHTAHAELLKVAVPDLKPFGYTENGKVVGIVADYSHEIADRLERPLHMFLVPYNRMVFLLEQGNADFSIYYRAPKTSEKIVTLIKVANVMDVIVSPVDRPVRSIQDLHGRKLATIRGGTAAVFFAKTPQIEQVTTNGYEHSIKLLLRNRVDAIVGVGDALYFNLQRSGVVSTSLAEPLELEIGEAWVHVSHRSSLNDVDGEFMNVIRDLVSEDLFASIRSKYIDEAYLPPLLKKQ